MPKEKREYEGVKFEAFKTNYIIQPITLGEHTYISAGLVNRLSPETLKTILLHEKYHQLAKELKKPNTERNADLYAANLVGKNIFKTSFEEWKAYRKIDIRHLITHGSIDSRIKFIENSNEIKG